MASKYDPSKEGLSTQFSILSEAELKEIQDKRGGKDYFVLEYNSWDNRFKIAYSNLKALTQRIRSREIIFSLYEQRLKPINRPIYLLYKNSAAKDPILYQGPQIFSCILSFLKAHYPSMVVPSQESQNILCHNKNSNYSSSFKKPLDEDL